jgi:pilus assembly protein FimV
MTKFTPRLLLMGALLSPASLYALGLGEIRLNSALNQPLDAEIELIAPTQEELQSLRVSLASADTFARYGLDRPQFLSSVRFEIVRGRNGINTIKITSTRSITEPFVTLLVEASWARGRLLREYTVLLDPPVFMPGEQEAPAVVQAPRSGTTSEGRIEREAQTPAPAPVPAAPPQVQQPTAAPSAPAGDLVLGGTYAVQRNDTLYRIAERVRPGSRRQINQTMIALYRANPDAFAGSIHRLKAGSVLRIPDAAEIEATSLEEATREVARQTEEWRAQTESGRLQLVPPTETASERAAPDTAPAPAPDGQTPTTTPVRPEAPVAAASPGTAAEPSPTERPIAVPDAGLSQMQKRLAEEEAAAPATETPPAAQPAATTAAQVPATEQPETPAARPAPAAPVEESAFLAALKSYWWALAALLAAIAAAAFVISRRGHHDESEDAFASLNDEPGERSAPSISPARDIPDHFGMKDEPRPAYTPPVQAREPEPTPAVAAPSIDDTLSSETAVHLDQQDAIAEADFHMAYGLYDQAADLVKIAIEREPERRDLQLKLLEIYFVWGNKDLFLETARSLHATRAQAAPGEWDKVVIMGRQIAPEDPLFQSEGALHVDAVDVNLEGGENRVDIDLFGEPEAGQGKGLDIEFGTGEHVAVKTDGDSSIDFLLDEPTRGVEEEPTRELDPLARTQETPTIESPMLGAARHAKPPINTEQTAELSLDDLGLDVDELDHSSAHEDTGVIQETAPTDIDSARPLGDDEMTQLAPSLGSLDRTMEAPRHLQFDVESTNTIAIDPVDLEQALGDTVEQRKPADLDATAAFQRPAVDVNLDDLDALGREDSGATIRQPRLESEEERFSNEVFSLSDTREHKLDLDVGDALDSADNSSTNTQAMTAEMELAEEELEPVTMSEVGTKLDLARAYMDMGDPDGARSILEEVLEEGNENQKLEAQRLLEAVK